MRSASDALRAAALAGVSFPVRAVVRAAYCRPAAAGYAVDLEVVHRATLQPTGELVAAVPLSPLWLGADGRGLYAPPQVGQIVILAWVEGDRGHRRLPRRRPPPGARRRVRRTGAHRRPRR